MCLLITILFFIFFFFNDTATTEIYTLSLHDALPIFGGNYAESRLLAVLAALLHSLRQRVEYLHGVVPAEAGVGDALAEADRKSTRLNSSHGYISYAVFCLKKKKQTTHTIR